MMHYYFSSIFVIWKKKHPLKALKSFFYANLPIDNVRMSVPQNDKENDGS